MGCVFRASVAAWLLLGLAAPAAPVWKASPRLALGELLVLELREEDPAKPPPLRPTVEDRLGPLRLRAMEPLADGRGWRFQVQALVPGPIVIPALELGNGQRSPELRLQVTRTIPFGGPWMGYGGGREDRHPAMPFPWGWASLLLLPPSALAVWGALRWRSGGAERRLRQRIGQFHHHWPPADRQRATLDTAHALGRELLAARFGDAARAWGPADFEARNLAPWAQWVRSLDAARFGHAEPAFPPTEALVTTLQVKVARGSK